MTTIADLIALDINPEVTDRRKAKVTILSSPIICRENAKPDHKYQCEVFNFLLEKKDSLGIQTVIQFMNLRVDGAIVLVDGRRLVVEIKYRMNWKKALEAGYEFRRFLLMDEAKENPVSGAIVLFEEFQGSGWDRQAQCRYLENGWNEWYESFSKIEGYRLDLLRIKNREIEFHGMAMVRSMLAKNPALLAEQLAQ